jgi:phosphatidylinositol glycan class F
MPTSTSKSSQPTLALSMGTHIHSALLLGASCLSFPSLVASPAGTLLTTLPFLALLQAGYAVLHLPPSAATPTSAKSSVPVPSKPGAPRRKIKKSDTNVIGSRILPAILSLSLSSTAGSIVLYLLLVAFGAPVSTHFAETALSAAHLSLLVVFPLVFRLGVDSEKWREVIAMEAVIDEAFAGAVGACVGAWLGAIPIPLGRCSRGSFRECC